MQQHKTRRWIRGGTKSDSSPPSTGYYQCCYCRSLLHCLEAIECMKICNNVFLFCVVGSLRKLDQRFSEFKFLQEPEDVVVVRNKPAILHCEASLSGPGSSRNVKIKWKRDGEFLNFPDFNDRR